MKRMVAFALIFMLCAGAASALAANSPALESYTDSGIRQNPTPGRLQKTLLDTMRMIRSTRLLDVISERDTMFDASGAETKFLDADINVIFTPAVYRVNEDGTADLILQLADVNLFKTADGEKQVTVVVGIPKGYNAGVSYYEISAGVTDGKVRAVFPAALVTEMKSSIQNGWNCVCMVVSREAQAAPDENQFALPAEESEISA